MLIVVLIVSLLSVGSCQFSRGRVIDRSSGGSGSSGSSSSRLVFGSRRRSMPVLYTNEEQIQANQNLIEIDTKLREQYDLADFKINSIKVRQQQFYTIFYVSNSDRRMTEGFVVLRNSGGNIRVIMHRSKRPPVEPVKPVEYTTQEQINGDKSITEIDKLLREQYNLTDFSINSATIQNQTSYTLRYANNTDKSLTQTQQFVVKRQSDGSIKVIRYQSVRHSSVSPHS